MAADDPVQDATEPRTAKRKRKRKPRPPAQQSQALDEEDFASLVGGIAYRRSQGEDDPRIRASLLEQGYPERIVNDALASSSRLPNSKDVNVGAVFMLCGLALSFITYLAASADGGLYVIATGPMAYGFFRFMRGISR